MEYNDPTRRPALHEKKIIPANNLLSSKFKNVNFHTLSQKKGYEILTLLINEVLDKYCPLFGENKTKRRQYRFPMSKETRLLRKKSLDSWYKIKRLKGQENLKDIPKLLEVYRKNQKIFNASKNMEKRRYLRSIITQKVDDNVSPWEIVKLLRPNLHKFDNQITVINDKSGIDLANYMSEYLYKRANLVSECEKLL
jgi:hypothetical protein